VPLELSFFRGEEVVIMLDVAYLPSASLKQDAVAKVKKLEAHSFLTSHVGLWSNCRLEQKQNLQLFLLQLPTFCGCPPCFNGHENKF